MKMAHPEVAMQMAYEYLYVGPQLLGQTYLREPVSLGSE